jgi:hypothetical protein
VNLNSKENRTPVQVLLISMLCIGLLFLVYMVAFRQSPLDADAQLKANGTKTAVALTAGPLLSPFPTSTAPTVTPSDTPTITSTIPTATPTATRTPTKTPTLIPTFTPRTVVAHSTFTSTPIPTSTPRPPSTRTPVPPTNTPVIIVPTDIPTDIPPDTQVPPTSVPPTPIIEITIPPIIQTLIP